MSRISRMSMPSRSARRPAMRWFAVIAGFALVVGLSSCSSDDNSAATTSTSTKESTSTTAKAAVPAGTPIDNAITITTPGMSFEVSGKLRPGIGSITFKNTDSMSHMLAVARLKDGVTLDQVKAAATSPDESAANKITADGTDAQYGTPAPVGPGQESTVVAKDLKAGTYAILCFLTTDDGTPHVALGMIGEFTVEGAPATQAPETDGTITVDDKGFTMPTDFNGKGVFEVSNTGTSVHDMQIVRIEQGFTLAGYSEAVGQAMNSNKSVDSAKGGTMVGGISGLNAGQSAWIVLDLPPGHYGYLSTTDATAGPPAQVGEFTVS